MFKSSTKQTNFFPPLGPKFTFDRFSITFSMISCVALEVVAELTRRENRERERTEREHRENKEKSRGSRILDGVKVLRILHVYDGHP